MYCLSASHMLPLQAGIQARKDSRQEKVLAAVGGKGAKDYRRQSHISQLPEVSLPN